VTRPARATLLPVHVQPVEVLSSVAEQRQAIAPRLEDQVRDVTAEAQAVQLYLERRVELRRIVLAQQPEVLTRMRLMTGGAGPQANRAVVHRVILQQGGHIGQCCPGGGLQRAVVTTQALLWLRLLLQMPQFRGMRGVAGFATARARRNPVYGQTGRQRFLDILVA